VHERYHQSPLLLWPIQICLVPARP